MATNLEFLHLRDHLIDHDGIYIAVRPMEEPQQTENRAKNRRAAEKKAGNLLIQTIAEESLNGGSGFELRRDLNGRPEGTLNEYPVGVSIAHSRTMILGGINCYGRIGVDLEPQDRIPHPRLLDRIRCNEDRGCEFLSLIRLWTIKEAALKWHGTGLRFPMSSVAIRHLNDNVFSISIADKSARLISFLRYNHWIAIALDYRTS